MTTTAVWQMPFAVLSLVVGLSGLGTTLRSSITVDLYNSVDWSMTFYTKTIGDMIDTQALGSPAQQLLTHQHDSNIASNRICTTNVLIRRVHYWIQCTWKCMYQQHNTGRDMLQHQFPFPNCKRRRDWLFFLSYFKLLSYFKFYCILSIARKCSSGSELWLSTNGLDWSVIWTNFGASRSPNYSLVTAHDSECSLIQPKISMHCLFQTPLQLVGCPHRAEERHKTVHSKWSSPSLISFFQTFFGMRLRSFLM